MSATTGQTGPISSSHAQCISSFEELIRTLQNHPQDLSGPEFSAAAKDEFGRYKVWAGNVGAAHHSRAYRLSLDYRLKDASFYRDRVLELLADLDGILQRIISILNGESTPFEEQVMSTEPEFESDDTSEPEEFSSDSSESDDNGDFGASLQAIREKVEKLAQGSSAGMPPSDSVPCAKKPELSADSTEIGQASLAIRDIVKSLYKLAMVIRRPLPSDRHTKSTKIDVQHFAEFDYRYVCDKFPGADPDVSARLGRGITRRRQLLKYRELHNQQMQAPSNLNQFLINWESRSKVSNSQPTQSTTATTFIPKTPMVMEEVQSVADTVSSYNSVSSSQEVINVPPRPRGSDGEELEEFECPYCRVLCGIKGSTAWKHHVLRDLEPYLCTFSQCQKPDQMYASRSDWQAHELEHRVEWFCNIQGHTPFRFRDEFTHHMIESHGFARDSSQTTLLMDSFRRSLAAENSFCPLCKVMTKNLEGHVARHLTQLALFAVPKVHYSDDRSDLGSNVSRDAQIRSSDSEYSGLESRPIDDSAKSLESQDLDPDTSRAQKDDRNLLPGMETVQDELIRLSIQLSVDVDINKQTVIAYLMGPWGPERTFINIQVTVIFPNDYPATAPTILFTSIDLKVDIPEKTRLTLNREIRRIAEEYASRREGSLKIIFRILLGESYIHGSFLNSKNSEEDSCHSKGAFADKVGTASGAVGIGQDAYSEPPSNDSKNPSSFDNETISEIPIHSPNLFAIETPAQAPEEIARNQGWFSRGGDCVECVKKQELGHFNAREPKYCPRHQCEEKYASGIFCTTRKKAGDIRCPDHTKCTTYHCSSPRSLDDQGKVTDYCFDHRCYVEKCPEGKAHDPRRNVYDAFCATHLINKCAVASCLHWRTKTSRYCDSHVCIVEDCISRLISESRPFCLGHNLCRVQGCMKERCQFGNQFETVCVDHYVAPCQMVNCNLMPSGPSAFCKIHGCQWRNCLKEARPGRWKLFCVDHNCAHLDCSSLRTFKEFDGKLQHNEFCFLHECQEHDCIKQTAPEKPYCNSHCCTEPTCQEARDGHPQFGSLCYPHYESRIRDAASLATERRLEHERLERHEAFEREV